jgi:hypothetical protein
MSLRERGCAKVQWMDLDRFVSNGMLSISKIESSGSIIGDLI